MSSASSWRGPVLSFALALSALAPALRADEPSLADQALAQEQELTRTVQRLLQSYVFIGARGSGVLISADGYILTNDHVAGSQPSWRVRMHEGTAYTAKLVGTDPYGDISLLKVDAPGVSFPFVELADSDATRVGETVIAIGNPFGLANIDEQPTVTFGLVSAICRPQVIKGLPDSVMTDAPLNPGNSGGPLLDLAGRLVGINGQIHTRHQTRSNSGIGYAISANQIRRFLPVLKAAQGGMVQHGWLPGVAYPGEPNSRLPQVDARHLFVDQITGWIARRLGHPNTPIAAVSGKAAESGLLAGDVILAIDGHAVRTPMHALARVMSYPNTASPTLRVRRGEAELDIAVALDPLPIRGQADLGCQFMGAVGRRLVITEVTAGSPAEKAGLKVGDRLVSLAGIDLAQENEAQLNALLKQLKDNFVPDLSRLGAKAEITVMREGQSHTLVLEVARGAVQLGFALGIPTTVEKVEPLRVRGLIPGGAAERAGLQENDVVLGLSTDAGEKLIGTIPELDLLVRQKRPGDTIQVLIQRDGQRQTKTLTLGLKRELP